MQRLITTTCLFHSQGGVDLTVTELDQNPATFLWGKIRKAFGFGDVSLRGVVDAYDQEVVDLEVRANGFETGVQLLGQAGESQIMVFAGIPFVEDCEILSLALHI